MCTYIGLELTDGRPSCTYIRYDPEHDYIMQRVNMMTGGQG